ncbi:MAG TPA: hypothetical protein VFQ61_13290 [Polyangiaceae bacterium]|nr:hypothetical protein [Polyangiaceae bacterium]
MNYAGRSQRPRARRRRTLSSFPAFGRGLSIGLCLAGLAWVSPARAEDRFFGPDKTLHFGASMGLAAGGYAVSGLIWEEPWQRSVAGASLALSAGAAKELWDLSGHGDPSWNDVAWDVIGTAVGVGLVLCVDLVLRHAEDRDGNRKQPSRTGATLGTPPLLQKSQAKFQLRW